MQQEIRFATFNVLNLAPPGLRFYDGIEPYTPEQYDAKVAWLARKFRPRRANSGAERVGIRQALARGIPPVVTHSAADGIRPSLVPAAAT